MRAQAATIHQPTPGNPAISQAAEWLASHHTDRTGAVLPQLRNRFSLSVKESIEACRQAALIRARAYR